MASSSRTSLPPITALLIDLSGTLHIGDKPTPNAPAALARLRRSGIPFRLCSNTTKESEVDLLERLRRIGFEVDDDELVTSLGAARRLVQTRGYTNPLLLLSASAKRSFPPAKGDDHDCVVVGLAPEELSYPRLNQAFRVLKQERPDSAHREKRDGPKPALIATHRARYFGETDGALSLGPGPFISALEEAADVKAEIVGKPTRTFYEQTLAGIGEQHDYSTVAMVGDDVKGDLGHGAIECGFVRVLVKTGKYRDGDENKGDKPPDLLLESFSELVDMLLER